MSFEIRFTYFQKGSQICANPCTCKDAAKSGEGNCEKCCAQKSAAKSCKEGCQACSQIVRHFQRCESEDHEADRIHFYLQGSSSAASDQFPEERNEGRIRQRFEEVSSRAQAAHQNS
ncbi:MAG: hypothetical protein H7222_16250 [Methylotenera sp.]|nr:hypothetical protein [Oligoflexia bacterium]